MILKNFTDMINSRVSISIGLSFAPQAHLCAIFLAHPPILMAEVTFFGQSKKVTPEMAKVSLKDLNDRPSLSLLTAHAQLY